MNCVVQRGNADGQQAHEKMFNITSHQGNANQNHSEIALHICQNGHHQKQHKQQYWPRCGENGTLVHCWWEYKLMQSLWKTIWLFLKTLNKAKLSASTAGSTGSIRGWASKIPHAMLPNRNK